MEEVNSKGLSVSFRVDDRVIEHNNRDSRMDNVNRIRTQDRVLSMLC